MIGEALRVFQISRAETPCLDDLETTSLRNHIPVRIVNRHVAKRRHLIFHLVPVTHDHNRGMVGVEVFRRHALDVGRGKAPRSLDESRR